MIETLISFFAGIFVGAILMGIVAGAHKDD